MREYTKWALQEVVGWEEFERICTDFLYCQHGFENIRQAGGTRDGGRDAVILHDDIEAIVFAFSMEQNPLAGGSSKFFREYSRWTDKHQNKFVFISNQDLGARKIDLQQQLSEPPVEIFDITDLVRFLDLTPEGNKVKQNYGLAGHEEPFLIRTDEGHEEELLVTSGYTILSLEDVSHGTAKRYSANLLLNGRITESGVKKIIKEVTDNLRGEEYYRNNLVKARWAGTPAHVVWLFIYASMEDIANANWICSSQWISETLDPKFAPLKLDGNDEVDRIVIDWNEEYEERAKIFRDSTVKKEEYLENTEAIRERTEEIALEIIELTKKLETGELVNEDYVSHMKALEPELTDLYSASGNIGLPPVECVDLDDAFQGMMVFAHNMVLPFSERGLKTWTEEKRISLVTYAIEGYRQDFEKAKIERKKIR